jgi:hypothetical protein
MSGNAGAGSGERPPPAGPLSGGFFSFSRLRSLSAFRRRYSIWPLRERKSSSAHFLSASRTSASILNRKDLRSAIGPASAYW